MWKLSLILMIFFSCAESAGVQEVKVNVASENIDLHLDTSYIDTLYSAYGKEMLLGHFDPANHEDFTLVEIQHADRKGMFIHKDTYKAFKEMNEAAEKEGINLVIRSATRNFEYQKGIWERKWNGETKVGGEDLSQTILNPEERALKILQYSSMPGTSRHHWGSDIDLNSFDNAWFETGEGRKLWDWLESNAAEYGFCRPYSAKGDDRQDGYEEERWHWSYMPLSAHFMNLAKKIHSDKLIEGFQGAEAAEKIAVVEKYVFGISPTCSKH